MPDPSLFKTTLGMIPDTKSVDDVRNFVFTQFKDELKERPSFHKYVTKLPQNFQDMVSKIRDSPTIREAICKQYTHCDITPLPDTDELYVSHYNIDGGGDQGLFNKHYDGVLRLLDDATVVRALVYVNSKDDFVVHFLDSDVSHNFKTNEFGLLDFNREYHWVEGKYNDKMDINDTRILLKINYLVCPKCSEAYARFVIWLNWTVFYIVKSAMEFSKSPKTPAQYFIGFFCNLYRVANNISVWMSVLLTFVLLGITGLALYGTGLGIGSLLSTTAPSRSSRSGSSSRTLARATRLRR